MSGQPFLPLYGKDRASLERQNERVMIERIEKEDIESQIYKDILMSDDHRNKETKIHKLKPTRMN